MNTQQALVEEKRSYTKIDAPCPYFGTCGGCALQDLSYQDQLALKCERLRRVLAPIEGAQSLQIVGLDDPWRYRNKAELSFGGSAGQVTLGYHAAGSFWRVVDLDDCLLLPKPVMQVLRNLRAATSETQLPAYHPRTHQGFFRYVLVRSSHVTGKILICLMTTPGPRDVMERLATHLLAQHPALASVYWGVTSKLADIAVPDELFLLGGTAILEDQLGPFRIELHPLSFLQPTSVQADRLYRRLCHSLDAAPHGTAWDLYCGLGLVGLYLSQSFEKVYGIDVEAHHLEGAVRNAALNGIRNVEFRAGRVETLLMDRRFWLQEAKPDVIVVDPPRAGLHTQALSSLLAARPRCIAYVSCNAISLARDLAVLLSSFPRYRVVELHAFDMFPQTPHVEVLAVLTRG